MMQPTLFPSGGLPFEEVANPGPGPAESSAREEQPSLLGPRAGQETDCVNALLGERWSDAEGQLERLREMVSQQYADAIDEALPLVRDLAARPALTHAARLERVLHAARFSPANPWVRHASLALIKSVAGGLGSARLAQTLDERALPFTYALLRDQSQEEFGVSEARALLRDSFVAGKNVDLLQLRDRDVLDLDGEGVASAWYPVLGVLMGLWEVPKGRPSRDETVAALGDPIPADDAGRARLFWQCLRVWKAQRQPNDAVITSRRRMKLLNPDLFARIG